MLDVKPNVGLISQIDGTKHFILQHLPNKLISKSASSTTPLCAVHTVLADC